MDKVAIACSEMDFILNNMEDYDLEKIPERIKKFFRENKDENFEVKITTDKRLDEQDMELETKVFLQMIYKLFLAPYYEKVEYVSHARKTYVQLKSQEWLNNRKGN